ncbi:hypothetical protein B0I35DRAFT_440950 [Stachybotrys elegans]|uniref:Uncharacterized protein n=1 Tax=Stachybotrys elegans TaxID=80388 RepID=A0A8K0WM12_9HYPO|nr:hypothetical protein B0I35DRAFT_440950 [Stachybotrys elegans]
MILGQLRPRHPVRAMARRRLKHTIHGPFPTGRTLWWGPIALDLSFSTIFACNHYCLAFAG